MPGRRLSAVLATASLLGTTGLLSSAPVSAATMSAPTPAVAALPDGSWTPVYRHDFTTLKDVSASHSSDAVNGSLLPTDSSNDVLQKPIVRSNVTVVADPAATDGSAVAAYTRQGTYSTASGIKTGWTNGRFMVKNQNHDVPVRVTARVRLTAAAGAKAAVMWWPAGGGWPWEVDFVESFGGKSTTDYWGSRQNIAQRWHGDLNGDGRAVEQQSIDTRIDGTKYHVYDLFITRDRMWVKIDGVTAHSTTDKNFIPSGPGYFAVGKALTGSREGAARTQDAVYVDYLQISKPAAHTAPTASVRLASQGVTSADVVAAVQTGGLPTQVRFEYSAPGVATTTTSPVTVSADGDVRATLSGLAPGTTYSVRAIASNTAGTTTSAAVSLTTPAAPVVTAPTVTAASQTSLTLTGTVSTSGLGASVWAEYGTTSAFGASVPAQVDPSGRVTATLPGLTARSVYNVRFVATTDAGTTKGSPAVVGTTGAPNASVSGVTPASTSVTMDAYVRPFTLTTTYYVEYGTTTAYGKTTQRQVVDGGLWGVRVAPAVTGLTPGTCYRLRLVAENAEGTTRSGAWIACVG